jgi:hypothetical protein
MDVKTIMTQLKAYGNEGVKKIFLKHGIKEPFFGVKIEHLKIIQKKIINSLKTSTPQAMPMPCTLPA